MNTLATLAFYAAHPGWQSFDKRDRNTVRAVHRLTCLGFLELSEGTNQARFTGKVFA